MSALLTSTCPGPCTAAEQMAEVLQLFACISSDENLLSFPTYTVIREPYSACLHKRPHRWPYLVIQPPSFLSALPCILQSHRVLCLFQAYCSVSPSPTHGRQLLGSQVSGLNSTVAFLDVSGRFLPDHYIPGFGKCHEALSLCNALVC